MNIDIDRLSELVDLVKSARISELTIRDGEECVTIKKSVAPAALPVGDLALPAPVVREAVVEVSEAPPMTIEEPAEQPPRYVPVRATMVGTFYLSDKPGGEPLVRVGQQAETGQVVCTIESMKLVHEVHAPATGTIVQILAEDGQPVEYGNELMLLEVDESHGSG